MDDCLCSCSFEYILHPLDVLAAIQLLNILPYSTASCEIFHPSHLHNNRNRYRNNKLTLIIPSSFSSSSWHRHHHDHHHHHQLGMHHQPCIVSPLLSKGKHVASMSAWLVLFFSQMVPSRIHVDPIANSLSLSLRSPPSIMLLV